MIHVHFSSVESDNEGLHVLPECSVSIKEPGAKTTQVEAHMQLTSGLLYKLSQLRTMTGKLHGRLLTDGMHGS